MPPQQVPQNHLPADRCDFRNAFPAALAENLMAELLERQNLRPEKPAQAAVARQFALGGKSRGSLNRRNIAGSAMKVGSIVGVSGFKAIRNAINNWHLRAIRLRQADRSSLAALRAL